MSSKVEGIVAMLSSKSRVLPCSSMGLTQLFLMVFLFRLAWDTTTSSQAKCLLFFLLPSSLLPSDSDDELLAAFFTETPRNPSDVGPRESSGCTSMD
uniref:Uncharacterized protein n=1 Tax=Leersia perrieri TaxID=77586 RepID=A0A0D9XRI0_9ORYZ